MFDIPFFMHISADIHVRLFGDLFYDYGLVLFENQSFSHKLTNINPKFKRKHQKEARWCVCILICSITICSCSHQFARSYQGFYLVLILK